MTGTISIVDGVGIHIARTHRAGDVHDAATVLAVRAVLAVLAVQHIEGVRAVGVRDGNLSASGCGSSHYDGREAVRTVGASRASRTLLAITQHIALSCAIRQRQHQHVARVGGRDGKSRHIACAACIQCVRNAQQLLHALDAVVYTAIGVNFRLQIERTITPRNLAEVLAGVTASHLNREQAVHVCCCRVRLRIDRRTRGTALQNGQTDGNLLFRHQGVVAVAHHRLIAHLLRRLRKQRCHCEQHQKQKSKNLFHYCVFLLNIIFSNSPFRASARNPLHKPSLLHRVFDDLEGFQQHILVEDTQLIGGRRVFLEVHFRLGPRHDILLEELAVRIKELGGEAVAGNLVVGNPQLHKMLCRVRIDHRLQVDAGVVVHPHALDFVGLLHTFDDVLGAVGGALHCTAICPTV